MVTTSNHTDHARMRGLLKGAFTEKALRHHEGIIQSCVYLLISSLRQTAPSGISVNTVVWLNYAIFDIVGDLGFGEPFDRLRNSADHPWVFMIFSSIRIFSFAAATRYYPLDTALSSK